MNLAMAFFLSASDVAEWTNAIANLLKVLGTLLLAFVLLNRYREEFRAILEALPLLLNRLKSGELGPLKIALRGFQFPPETVDNLEDPVETVLSFRDDLTESLDLPGLGPPEAGTSLTGQRYAQIIMFSRMRKKSAEEKQEE